MDQFCFGVDLGGTTVKIGLFTVDGMLQEKWEIPTRTENQGAAILSDIAASIQNKVDVRHLCLLYTSSHRLPPEDCCRCLSQSSPCLLYTSRCV